VKLGEQIFEVVEEREEPGRVVYHLRPWPEGQVLRQTILYGEEFIRGIQEQRLFVEKREKARRYSWLFYPFVGLLPEDEQIRVADRFGLDPIIATFSSGLFEALLAFWLWSYIAKSLQTHHSVVLPLAAPVFGMLFVVPGALRAVFAILLNEVAGSLFVAAARRVRQAFASERQRLDRTFLPLTRQAFRKRLLLPDRHTKEADGALLVESLLPHLSWVSSPRLVNGEDIWMVSPLPPVLRRGRLTFSYRLNPLTDPENAGDLPPPGQDTYQREVMDRIDEGWERRLDAGGAWLVSLLPSATQQRALGSRRARAVQKAAAVTAATTLVAGIVLLAVGGTMMVFFGLILTGDAAFRFLRISRARFAPSLLGLLLGDIASPESRSYRDHREAEREALRRME
jgi:hypothetical protein